MTSTIEFEQGLSWGNWIKTGPKLGEGGNEIKQALMDMIESKHILINPNQSWLHLNENKQGLVGLNHVCSYCERWVLKANMSEWSHEL